MDLLCRHCREPWEFDTLHEEAKAQHVTFDKIAAEFRALGCEAFGISHNELGKPSAAADALYELLGDDMDGAAAMFEDLEAMGGIF